MIASLEHKISLSDNKTAPLVFFVHGRAGNKEVMWTFRRTVPEHCTVIAPQAPRPDPIGGFSWWDVQGEITNEMIDEGVLKLSLFIDEAIQEYNLQPSMIIGYGFSQGSGALSLLMQRRRKLFSGVAILAGFVIKDWNEPTHGEDLPPVFIAHGTADAVVPITRTREGAQWLQARGSQVTLVEDDVGHKVGSSGMRELKNWTQLLLGR